MKELVLKPQYLLIALSFIILVAYYGLFFFDQFVSSFRFFLFLPLRLVQELILLNYFPLNHIGLEMMTYGILISILFFSITVSYLISLVSLCLIIYLIYDHSIFIHIKKDFEILHKIEKSDLSSSFYVIGFLIFIFYVLLISKTALSRVLVMIFSLFVFYTLYYKHHGKIKSNFWQDKSVKSIIFLEEIILSLFYYKFTFSLVLIQYFLFLPYFYSLFIFATSNIRRKKGSNYKKCNIPNNSANNPIKAYGRINAKKLNPLNIQVGTNNKYYFNESGLYMKKYPYEVIRGYMKKRKAFIRKSVYRIRNYAFMNCDQIRSIYIPASVVEVGYRAFCSCRSLKSVKFAPNSCLKSIGGLCFAMTPIMRIIFPSTIEFIGGGAFTRCPYLQYIEIAKSENNSGKEVGKEVKTGDFIVGFSVLYLVNVPKMFLVSLLGKNYVEIVG